MQRFPQVCEDEKEMYKRLFAGADVKTLANMCEGDCSCSYQVKEKNERYGALLGKAFFLWKKRVI